MEFSCLARRQLQALCKRNKIPANMTNVAMADALSALDYVEGIEEIMQQQSPGKAGAGSPEEQRTVTRTSTRARKPPVESGGVVSQSRSRTSRKLVDDDSVVDENKEMTATSAVAGSRRRAPAAASRKKVEVPVMQRAYSTRRSVRLVEKEMSELCLGESKERTRAIKIDDELSSEMTESDVKGDNIEVEGSEKIVEELHESDEVMSSETSAQLMVTVDAACVVNGNEVMGNCVTDAEASENVGKDTAEVCAEGAVGEMGNADAEKDMEIVGDILSDLGEGEDEEKLKSDDSQVLNVESDVLVKGEVDEVTGICVTHTEAFENVEKDIAVVCAEGAVGEMGNADAEKEMEIVGDNLAHLVDGEGEEKVKSDDSQVSEGESDVPVKGEVSGELLVNLEKEISNDSVFHAETIDEVSFKTPADLEKAENYINEEIKSETEAYEHETETCVLSTKEEVPIEANALESPLIAVEKVETEICVLSTKEEVAIEAYALESPLLALEKVETDTTFQVDECDHDADSMTCQMGSPIHLFGHLEDLNVDSKPLDSAISTVDSVEQVVDGELFADKVEELSGTEPKLVTVELNLDTEMPVYEETLELASDNIEDLIDDSKPLDSISTVNSVEQAVNGELFEDKVELLSGTDPKLVPVELKLETETCVSEETLELTSDASLALKSADPKVEHLKQQLPSKNKLQLRIPTKRTLPAV